MLAHRNDGQALVLLKPCSTSGLPTIHMGKEEFQRCFKPPPTRPGPWLLCTVRVGFQPTQAEKGASLAKSLPSQRPLNLAICERSLSAWIPPGPFPSAHKAPCLLSPAIYRGVDGRSLPRTPSTRSFILFIRHSSLIHRLRFYYMEVSLPLPPRFRDTLTRATVKMS